MDSLAQRKDSFFSTVLVKSLLTVVLIGSFLAPPLPLLNGFPKFELSILLLPVLAILALFYLCKQVFETVRLARNPLIFLLVFVVLMAISIIVNHRLSIVRDWFEIVKFVEFGFYFVLFQTVFSFAELRRIMVLGFLAVIVFNVFHYFDWFHFNSIIEPFYAPKHHLDYFGLNSLGLPATKRALGVLGNPNNNAVLFLLFLWIFVPGKPEMRMNKLWLPTLAVLGVFMCQSRTGFLAFLLVLLLYLWSIKTTLRYVLYYILICSVFFFGLKFLGNTYLDSLIDKTAMENAGVGRLTQWKRIFDSMPGHWVFGHAPNKEYFEQHGIHSESEYFLILFRYGLLGLVSFVVFWLSFLPKFSIRLWRRFSPINYVVFAYFILAITNNPMHSPKLMLMFAGVLALSFLNTKYVEVEKN